MFNNFSSKHFLIQSIFLKAGLHRNANMNAACENDAYVHVGKVVDCLAFAEAANWPYINVLYANSLWCTDSQRIAFGCLPNVRHTAECCLPLVRTTSTSNVRIVFSCRVRILFAFRCKRDCAFRCKRGFTVFGSKVNLLSCFSKVKYCAALTCCDIKLTAP